jgi:hypothetical protein
MVISDEYVELGQVYGPIRVAAGGKYTLRGQVVGAVIVQLGGHALIRGMVQELVVEQGGSAQLPGRCTGNVNNLGGELVFSGTVGGRLIGRHLTEVTQGARVGR